MRRLRVPPGITIILGAVALVAVLGGAGLLIGGTAGRLVVAALTPSPAPSPSPTGEPTSAPPTASPEEAETDPIASIPNHLPAQLPDRVDLYAGAPSISAGQPLKLHVSTAAPTYTYRIERLDVSATGGRQVVMRSAIRPGHDYRSLATFVMPERTARANWPVTDTVATDDWVPGVYIVTAVDASKTVGHAIFVVRTPVLANDRPAFVFAAFTYQAYNLWGGANFYDYAAPRAVRVSFERPYALDAGTGDWLRGDDRILAWLQRQGLDLQYTTDYDLAIDPPAIAPGLLILPRHPEYVTGSLRDWVEEHVDHTGDMNVLGLGANGYYWQVRLAGPRVPGGPMDIVCYKKATDDPLAASEPTRSTTRWRDAPLNRPEGLVFGAQYVGKIGDGHLSADYTVMASMPPELLAGTGWVPGTVIHGLLKGEGDLVYPGSGGIAIMVGNTVNGAGAPLSLSVTIRTSPAGARIFDAGTLGWAAGFDPPLLTDLGVSAASLDQFERNVLAWLGFAPGP